VVTLISRPETKPHYPAEIMGLGEVPSWLAESQRDLSSRSPLNSIEFYMEDRICQRKSVPLKRFLPRFAKSHNQVRNFTELRWNL
jgi:hypothetical protein